MNKYILIFGFLTLIANGALASQNCFVVIENNIILNSEGDYKTLCSKSKLPTSLMIYDSDLLIDETHPIISHESTYLSARVKKFSFSPSIAAIGMISASCN